MAIDASIYQNYLRPVKSVQEYDNEAMQGQANALQLKQHQMQMNALAQQQADDQLLRKTASGFGADTDANYSSLLRAGLVPQAEAYKKASTDQLKVKSDADKARFDAAAKKIDIAGQAFNFVRQNPTLENAHAVIDYLGQNGVYSPDQVAQYKAQVQQNTGGIAQLADMAFRSALSAKDQLGKVDTRNLGGTTETTSVDPVTGAVKTLNVAKNTQSPDSVAQVAATYAGIAERRDAANKADARARDFNAVQVEANNIKRSEKKATDDLTKNSQIASFDTMLGTLDRLAAHPGLSRSVGLIGAMPTMPGSDSANFQAELNTFQSQAFLPMVAQLKGMGALSDAEGKKLTAAVGALDPKMGEQAFRDSVARITQDMKAARDRVSGTPSPKPSAQSAGNSVTTPDGQVHTFPTPAAAAAFKKAAGL